MTDQRVLLLIDDDEDDRELFIEALSEVDRNIQCIAAANGRQAIELLHDPAVPLPDFIFLDLRMPGHNGKKCLEQIKANPLWKNIPVIIYTTSRQPEDSRELINIGATHFMSKPRNADEIYYLISVVIEEQWNTTRAGA